MTDQDHQHALMQTPLLSGMEPAVAARLSSAFRFAQFSRGERLITVGEKDRVMMVLLSGVVEVQLHEDGRLWRLAQLQSGAVLGEIGFFEAFPSRSADVIGVKAGVIARLDPSGYQSLRDVDAAAFELGMLDALSERLSETNAGISSLLQQTISEDWFSDLRRWIFRFGER
ncbi:MAG: cyclic nucleotide-binding domain-containing protein [Myxococcota bacterium]